MNPGSARRVREAKKAREVRDWQKLAARNRERRDRPETPAAGPRSTQDGPQGSGTKNPTPDDAGPSEAKVIRFTDDARSSR